ncbi:TIGR00266 family protein [Streptococcus jiangjianxini]|uniref:TIGR00266 family protein n=1 Tax=Streptococcus jiangjianxini TaxID=3161189 RepID=UPI0032EC1F6A
MADQRMTYHIDSNMQFPLVEIALEAGESVYLQKGSMVYHTPGVQLNTRLNGRGEGLGKMLGALGRSMTSGESIFITQAISTEDNGRLALAPSMPGQVIALELGEKQYRLNDGAFLALDGSAQYRMKRQAVGKAFFGGQGGLFVMTTEGQGTLLANTFGSVKKLELYGESMTIDNAHVVAWSDTLDYDIHLENGFLQSIGTGEGIVNSFRGYGEIYVQSLNIETFSKVVGGHFTVAGNPNRGKVDSFLDLF